MRELETANLNKSSYRSDLSLHGRQNAPRGSYLGETQEKQTDCFLPGDESQAPNHMNGIQYDPDVVANDAPSLWAERSWNTKLRVSPPYIHGISLR